VNSQPRLRTIASRDHHRQLVGSLTLQHGRPGISGEQDEVFGAKKIGRRRCDGLPKYRGLGVTEVGRRR
jgi:hypothetical protein